MSPSTIFHLRIKGKGSVFQHVPVPERLSAALLDWQALQEDFIGRRILAQAGLTSQRRSLCLRDIRERRSQTVRSISDCARRAKRSGWGRSPPTGCATARPRFSLTHIGKDLREIQELLRDKNIRTTVRYTHVGYEKTRQTAEARSQALE